MEDAPKIRLPDGTEVEQPESEKVAQPGDLGELEGSASDDLAVKNSREHIDDLAA